MAARLQKIISQWGIASRRQAEQLILSGQVKLNGEPAQLGQSADPDIDEIEVQGRLLRSQNRPQHLYILLHKPVGVVSTCKEPGRRSSVLDLLPQPLRTQQGLHPVGRLDADSTGALLLTNDGHLTFALTHPRHHIPKTYRVWVQGNPSTEGLQQWRRGVLLDDRPTRPAQVQIICPFQPQHNRTQLEIVLREGRNRQIRRVGEQLGHPILALHRTKIGPLDLHQGHQSVLAPGQHRFLTSHELAQLKQLTLGQNIAKGVSP